ncbi:hypothetical protein K0504_02595 [Neiella marina]|uniref:Uncharacterized protein n=1 Tax=Neiella holothuriorum TaxID=2870530 RepID=A0ABS7EC57_9GAMM|nr:hypothetical protein [Neiella holothuriorum]MBW8189912.1 hypothetical protein [Neiella holothuriorum]
MSQFALIQVGYIGLFAFMLLVGGRVALAYIKADKPPENSALLVAMLFGLAITAAASGYVIVDRAVTHNQTIAKTAHTIQQELERARDERNDVIQTLHKAREQALFASSYAGNSIDQQNTQYQRAQQLTEMIELEEVRYQSELQRISEAFAAGTDNNEHTLAQLKDVPRVSTNGI